VEGLFREGGVGGELFADVAGVAAAAMRNPAHEGLSLGAVHAAEALARRLAAAGPQARPRRRLPALLLLHEMRGRRQCRYDSMDRRIV